MMGVCFQVFDCSIRQQDSELLKEISLFAQRLLDFFPQPFLIVWVNASPHIVSAWRALQRIKSPDAVTLVPPRTQVPVWLSLCACESQASPRRNVSSARLRSVTSTAVAIISTSSPVAENTGKMSASTCLTVPSGSLSLNSFWELLLSRKARSIFSFIASTSSG